MAELIGKWKRKETDAMLFGKYVHAWNEGKLDDFIKKHPQMFKKNGELYSQFSYTTNVINTIRKDKKIKQALSGKKEVIFTAEMFGIPWKILIDSYRPRKKQFSDLKTLRSLTEKVWIEEQRRSISIYEHRGYFVQIAIYAEIERLANKRSTDDYFWPYIVAVTKEKYPDKAIINFNSPEKSFHIFIAEQLNSIGNHIERIKAVKSGKETPNRCNTCEYCRSTKKLTGTVHYSEFEY
jgi:hypothetical protein